MRRLHAMVAVVALLWAATAIVLGPESSADAAGGGACTSSTGITVVVDFQGLGGTDVFCDTSGEVSAKSLFAAHESLRYSSSYPGTVVCQIAGQPSDATCSGMPPANKYWSLWLSDGSSGTWAYASEGVSDLTVPQGGYVAFSWQGSTSKASPRVPATAHPAVPSTPTAPVGPTTKASPKPAKKHPQKPATHPAPPSTRTSTSATTPASPSTTISPSGDPTSTSPASSPSTSAAATLPAASLTAPTSPVSSPATAPAADAPATSDGGGLPGWVPPVLVVVVLAAGGGIAVVRRRRS